MQSHGWGMTLLCPVLSVAAVVVCTESTEAGTSPPIRVVPSFPEDQSLFRSLAGLARWFQLRGLHLFMRYATLSLLLSTIIRHIGCACAT